MKTSRSKSTVRMRILILRKLLNSLLQVVQWIRTIVSTWRETHPGALLIAHFLFFVYQWIFSEKRDFFVKTDKCLHAILGTPNHENSENLFQFMISINYSYHLTKLTSLFFNVLMLLIFPPTSQAIKKFPRRILEYLTDFTLEDTSRKRVTPFEHQKYTTRKNSNSFFGNFFKSSISNLRSPWVCRLSVPHKLWTSADYTIYELSYNQRSQRSESTRKNKYMNPQIWILREKKNKPSHLWFWVWIWLLDVHLNSRKPYA